MTFWNYNGSQNLGAFSILRVLVRKRGLEPLRPFDHQILNLARLPIPPLSHISEETQETYTAVKTKARHPQLP